ncbi:uncharacterized protein TCAP_05686 [Tolypocladium capitatum]|uniref:Uncharacterized protein n=1 Tax=Tolypocladium capitatum TaxID=45235 RepID=A0A2K3QA54_9HYPO|nr:uncharacterized protein TCAP_05686 [Tolypocladium capitatum]
MAQRQRQPPHGHGHGAGFPPPPPFAAELEAAPLHGAVETPDGGVAFEMCGESAAPKPKGPEDETRRRPAQATDADVPAQANPWPFYLEETRTGDPDNTTERVVDDEEGKKAPDAAPAVPWPYHGPPLGEDGPRATVYPQAAQPAPTGHVKEQREGAQGDGRAEPQSSDDAPPGPEAASAAARFPAPPKPTQPHGTATSPPAPVYKPYSPPPDGDGAGQGASVGPSADETTGLAYRPYQPPPSPPPPPEKHPAAAVGAAPRPVCVPQGEAKTSSPPAPLKVAVAASTTSPSTVPAAVAAAAAAPGQRPATASPHPSTPSPSVQNFSVAPNTAHSPRPPSAASAVSAASAAMPPQIQYAPRPQDSHQPYPHGVHPYASPPPHHAMSGPAMSPQFSPLSPPPPYSYGGVPPPGSQPPQHSPHHPPPGPYPSLYPTQPIYAYGPEGGAPSPQGMHSAPPLPPRPAPGQFGPLPMGFGAGPAHAVAYPPPPKTMYAPGPYPPPLPPRTGSGGLFSSTSARKWLDKTSQVLESKLEGVLHGPPGPPHRPAHGPPPPRWPPGPPYQGGPPPPPGWHPGGQWGAPGGGGPGQGGTQRYA